MRPSQWEPFSAARAAGTALLVVGLAGCPPQRADLGMYTESDATTTGDPTGASVTSNAEVTSSQGPDDSSTSTTTSTDATTGTTGAVDSATTETGVATDTSGGDASSGSTGVPAPSCEPEAEEPIAYSEVGWQPLPDVVDGKLDFTAMCTIFGVLAGAEGQAHRIEMMCGATQVTLRFYMDFAELEELPQDHPVQFRYAHRAAPFWVSEWYTLVDTLPETPIFLLAAITSDTVTPVDLPDFFAPIGVEPLAGVCTAPPACPYPFERLAVRFTHGASSLLLTDNTSGSLGDGADLRVLLGQAKRYVEEIDDNNNRLCPSYTDQPYQTFSAVIVGKG